MSYFGTQRVRLRNAVPMADLWMYTLKDRHLASQPGSAVYIKKFDCLCIQCKVRACGYLVQGLWVPGTGPVDTGYGACRYWMRGLSVPGTGSIDTGCWGLSVPGTGPVSTGSVDTEVTSCSHVAPFARCFKVEVLIARCAHLPEPCCCLVNFKLVNKSHDLVAAS